MVEEGCGIVLDGERTLCGPECECFRTADAVIAVVLQEAAKVAEGPVKRRSLVTGEVIYRGDDEHDYAVDGSSDYGAGRIEAAADIRALKEKNDA
jgi:hypothetical protein